MGMYFLYYKFLCHAIIHVECPNVIWMSNVLMNVQCYSMEKRVVYMFYFFHLTHRIQMQWPPEIFYKFLLELFWGQNFLMKKIQYCYQIFMIYAFGFFFSSHIASVSIICLCETNYNSFIGSQLIIW